VEENQENPALLILQTVTHQETTGFVRKIGYGYRTNLGWILRKIKPSRASFLKLNKFYEFMVLYNRVQVCML